MEKLNDKTSGCVYLKKLLRKWGVKLLESVTDFLLSRSKLSK